MPYDAVCGCRKAVSRERLPLDAVAITRMIEVNAGVAQERSHSADPASGAGAGPSVAKAAQVRETTER